MERSCSIEPNFYRSNICSLITIWWSLNEFCRLLVFLFNFWALFRSFSSILFVSTGCGDVSGEIEASPASGLFWWWLTVTKSLNLMPYTIGRPPGGAFSFVDAAIVLDKDTLFLSMKLRWLRLLVFWLFWLLNYSLWRIWCTSIEARRGTFFC